ncbi:CubicO group peptidase (beta-lactamase class C family) [Hephaestia caeni]|uniref:CubicO group peptidase (Beta-lactamase class C family) n=1 Tax=Hephaestia caeni TaxID=645617 RepID=A0A397NSF4_9SPHN|nr:serine hydrolase [Hephaestia caeni]RIA36604.1 CubicO group peptidase (beta-lactamase class C family) [Hephaestia caeni]
MPISRRDMLTATTGAVSLAALGDLGMAGAANAAAATPDGAAGKAETNERFLARLLGRDKLFWSPNVQPEGYKSLERILATRPIRRGASVRTFPRKEIGPLTYQDQTRTETLDDFMKLEHVAGIIGIRDGVIRLERYGLGLKPTEHWTSMSMVKSITSTIVGCALHDRLVPSLDVEVARYVGVLKGSAYADVTLRQLLTMTSGIQWDENYMNPQADVNLHYEKVIADRQAGGILAHLATLPRAHPPGTYFHYNTGDTFVIGCLLTAAIGGHLADYFSNRIWSRIGTEQDALFLLESDDGQEVAGSSASATLRDYARFGEFILGGGIAGGRQVLPEGWVVEATKPSAPREDPAGGGYGYQWWTSTDGSFAAQGFAGQTLRIHPANKSVIVILSALPSKEFRPVGEASLTRRANFMRALDAMMGHA